MRILMLSGSYPIPTDNGAKRRIFATADYLSLHHDLTLVSFLECNQFAMLNNSSQVPWQDYLIDLPIKNRFSTALKSCFSKQSYGQVKYWNHNFQSLVDGILSKQHFDCIWIQHFNMVPYIEQYFIQSRSDQTKSVPIFVLDQHNVDELYYGSFLTDETNIGMKLYVYFEVVKARHLQKKWFPRFDAILCVASEDIQKTTQYVESCSGIWLAPNGVDIRYFQPIANKEFKERTSILVFGASFDVLMNQDAVRWFSGSILPSIKQQVPDVQFWIVGRNPTPEIQNLAGKRGISITGTVPDVRDYYKQADVFVVPLRNGGGTKLKTLEAMAMGLPVVSTSVGVQGLDVESGKHLYVVDNPEDFASSTVELLKNRVKAVSMGTEARRLVKQKYSWTGIMVDIERKLIDLLQKQESKRE